MLKLNIMDYLSNEEKIQDCIQWLNSDYYIDINKIIEKYDKEYNTKKNIDIDCILKILLEEIKGYIPQVPIECMQRGERNSKIPFYLSGEVIYNIIKENCINNALMVTTLRDMDSEGMLGVNKYKKTEGYDYIKDGCISKNQIAENEVKYATKKMINDNSRKFDESDFGKNFNKIVRSNNKEQTKDEVQTRGKSINLLYDEIYAYTLGQWTRNPYDGIISIKENDKNKKKELKTIFKKSKFDESKYKVRALKNFYDNFKESIGIDDDFEVLDKSTAVKKLLDIVMFNELYHYSYILFSFKALNLAFEKIMFKSDSIFNIDKKESKLSVITFIIAKLVRIPSPLSRNIVLKEILDRSKKEEFLLSRRFLETNFEYYIDELVDVTMNIANLVFQITLIEISSRKKNTKKTKSIIEILIEEVKQYLIKINTFEKAVDYNFSKEEDAHFSYLVWACCYIYNDLELDKNCQIESLNDAAKEKIRDELSHLIYEFCLKSRGSNCFEYQEELKFVLQNIVQRQIRGEFNDDDDHRTYKIKLTQTETGIEAIHVT